MAKQYSKTPDFISDEEKIRCNTIIYEQYYKLICSLARNYYRYLTQSQSYEDACHDIYIGLCKVYYYRYNYKNIDQKYFIITNILQLLDTKFPKKIHKVKWEQSLISIDSPTYFNNKQYENYKPCEKTVMCKYYIDGLFNFIRNMPVDRFYGNKKALDMLCFLKQYFLKLSDYNLYDLPHVIDLLAYNLFICETGSERRGKLYNSFKRYRYRKDDIKYTNSQLYPSHIFNTICNYFLVKVRLHLYNQGLYDYLMKDGD